MEERPDAQKQILIEIAKKLPIFTRAQSGAPVFVSGPDRNGFNLGLHKNLLQVFGEDRKLWFIPVFTR
ncbi:hypothetical protein GOODEAATRI_011981 [Goodea atripinnis]|uniref:Uncharacterized protein n=1 Tax=Goodea atripinnis TaxID=208336 RepID=A0ABV0MRF4_9TELE